MISDSNIALVNFQIHLYSEHLKIVNVTLWEITMVSGFLLINIGQMTKWKVLVEGCAQKSVHKFTIFFLQKQQQLLLVYFLGRKKKMDAHKNVYYPVNM